MIVEGPKNSDEFLEKFVKENMPDLTNTVGEILPEEELLTVLKGSQTPVISEDMDINSRSLPKKEEEPGRECISNPHACIKSENEVEYLGFEARTLEETLKTIDCKSYDVGKNTDTPTNAEMITEGQEISDEFLQKFIKENVPPEELTVLKESQTPVTSEYMDNTEDDSSSFERLVIDDGSLPTTEEEPGRECIDKRHVYIKKGDEFEYLGFEAGALGDTLKTIYLSNSYGVDREEEVLTLTKLRMDRLEHFDISFMEFASPEYSSKKEFAKKLWQHVADFACVNWPNIKTISAFGFDIDKRNAVKISTAAKNIEVINATVSSARASRDILAALPRKLAKRSNLCQSWDKIVEILNAGYAVTEDILPERIDINITICENLASDALHRKLFLDINGTYFTSYRMYAKIFFVYFLALNRVRDINAFEALLLSELCCKIVLMKETDAVKLEMEFFIESLLDFHKSLNKGNENTEIAKRVKLNLVFVKEVYKTVEHCCQGLSLRRIERKYREMITQ